MRPTLLPGAVAVLAALALGWTGTSRAATSPEPDPGPTAASPSATAPVPPPSSGPQPQPATPTSVPGPVRLVVTSMVPAEFRPDETVTLRGVVDGGTSGTGPITVVAARTRQRIDTRTGVTEWEQPLPGDERPATLVLGAVELGDVPPGTLRPFQLSIASSDLRLRQRSSDAGPYGLLLDVVTAPPAGTGEAADGGVTLAERRGFAVWSPDVGVLPTRLATVVEMPAVPADPATGLVDPADLETATGPTGPLRAALDAARELGGTWSVDSRLVASAAAAGAGPATRDWVADLAARGDRPLVLDAWGDPDPDLLAGTGKADELLELLSTVASATADQGRGSGGVEGIVGDPIATGIAVRPGPVTVQGVNLLAREDRAMVLPDTAVPVREASPYTPTMRTDLATTAGPLPVAVSDTPLATRVTAAASGDALATTAVMADLAALTLQRPNDPRTVGVLLADLGGASAASASALSTALASSRWVDQIGLDAWVAAPDPGVERVGPGELDPATAARASSAAAALLTSLGTLDSIDDAIRGGTDTRPLSERRAATAVAAGTGAMLAVAEDLQQDSAGLVSGVRIIPPSRVNLGTERALIPVTVVNDLGQDVSVTLQARSRSSRVRLVDPAVPVDVPAGQYVRVDLPVRAVANGNAVVSMRLLAPDTTGWGPEIVTRVSIVKVAEGGVLGVVAALTAIVFGLGTWRTIRRGRRSRTTIEP